jgi:hypothetical protein
MAYRSAELEESDNRALGSHLPLCTHLASHPPSFNTDGHSPSSSATDEGDPDYEKRDGVQDWVVGGAGRDDRQDYRPRDVSGYHRPPDSGRHEATSEWLNPGAGIDRSLGSASISLRRHPAVDRPRRARS